MFDIDEAYGWLEEFVETEQYDEIADEFYSSYRLEPAVSDAGDRGLIYIQTYRMGDPKERLVLGEFRNGELGPVPFQEEEIEKILDGAGEIKVDERAVAPREINFSSQREYV